MDPKKIKQQGSDIKRILKEATNGLLDSESLAAIEEAFNHEVEERSVLRESIALNIQDEEYSTKLIGVLEAVDRDNAKKLIKVVESVDKSNARKLKKVAQKFKTALNSDATAFKESTITHISDYLDLYIEENIPQSAINEAVKNKQAMSVLSALRDQLSIGTSLLDESVRAAVLDGRSQLDTLTESLKAKDEQLTLVNEKLRAVSANLLLEQRSAGLPAKKKEYLKRVLNNKSPEFIQENFDYTLKLYERKDNEHRSTLKEEAMTSRTTQEDTVETTRFRHPANREKLINEQASLTRSREAINPYLEQLAKYN